jgi:hypothetical protein
VTMRTDADLYRRGVATLLASWEEYARGSVGAAVCRLPGVAVAVFPNEPAATSSTCRRSQTATVAAFHSASCDASAGSPQMAFFPCRLT